MQAGMGRPIFAPAGTAAKVEPITAAEPAPKQPHRKAGKPLEPTPRQMAALQLQVGDFVEARDPVDGGWSPGTIHAIAKSGLVHVRWSDPGTDAHGKPFHPIGEVYAEQICVKRRKPSPPALAIAPQADKEEPTPVELPDSLKVGDTCYAEGTAVDKKWFKAVVLGVRARPPAVRVEYVSTLDGQATELCLPSPRKDYVPVDMIRRDKPEEPADVAARRLVREEKTKEAGASQEAAIPKGQEEDDLIITPDLMCTVCERPDNEAQMLVCDCGAGYHIFCLTPPLEEVPEGEWLCRACAKKA